MIEIRTFDGTADEVAAFTQRIWMDQFRDRVMVTLWDATYFDWQLLQQEPAARQLLVAAYDADRLVGCLFAQPFRFRMLESEFNAASSSWLTVDPNYRGQGVATSLATELLRRMRLTDCRFLLGFGIPGGGGRGIRFWSGFRENTIIGGTVGMWVRPIEFGAAARAVTSSLQRLGLWFLRITSILQAPPAVQEGIRDYRASDVGECLQLMTASARRSDLAYVWSEPKLDHHFRYRDVPQTFVSETNGAVDGVINYHPVTLFGRTALRAGMIDHVVGENGVNRNLLRAALHRMKSQGLEMAVTSRFSGASTTDLHHAGFFPACSGLRLIYFCDRLMPELSRMKRLRVHVR
jgi:GNAT superfamily N-acetyltransferase